MSEPRVSIVLPSRNGSRHLAEAIGSVAAQTFGDWELILVDDGSTDDTGAVMRSWSARDPRIRVVQLPVNRGLPGALNEGFRHARGALFGWTSDDNLLLPGAIERMAERLARDPSVGVVYADHGCFDESGREWEVQVASTRLLPWKNVIGYCFLYRREVHEALGGFDEGLFLAEDYDFWLRASRRFRFDAIPEVLYRCRVHGGSLSARRSAEVMLAVCRALDRHLPGMAPQERADALMYRAGQLLARGEPRQARRLAARALAQGPAVAFGVRHRRTLTACALGGALSRRLQRAFTPRREPAIQILLPDRPDGFAQWLGDLASSWPGGAPRPELARLSSARRSLGSAPGVLVACDAPGLASAARHGHAQHRVQILREDVPHGCELAERFEPWIDLFVTRGTRLRDALCQRLPHRAADIRALSEKAPGVCLHDLLANLMQRPIPHRPAFAGAERRVPAHAQGAVLPPAPVSPGASRQGPA